MPPVPDLNVAGSRDPDHDADYGRERADCDGGISLHADDCQDQDCGIVDGTGMCLDDDELDNPGIGDTRSVPDA